MCRENVSTTLLVIVCSLYITCSLFFIHLSIEYVTKQSSSSVLSLRHPPAILHYSCSVVRFNNTLVCSTSLNNNKQIRLKIQHQPVPVLPHQTFHNCCAAAEEKQEKDFEQATTNSIERQRGKRAGTVMVVSVQFVWVSVNVCMCAFVKETNKFQKKSYFWTNDNL